MGTLPLPSPSWRTRVLCWPSKGEGACEEGGDTCKQVKIDVQAMFSSFQAALACFCRLLPALSWQSMSDGTSFSSQCLLASMLPVISFVQTHCWKCSTVQLFVCRHVCTSPCVF